MTKEADQKLDPAAATTDPSPSTISQAQQERLARELQKEVEASKRAADKPKGKASRAPEVEEEKQDDEPVERPKLEDRHLDQIAEVITAEQIDRLVHMRARLGRRDAYRAAGIRPSTHIVTTGAVVIMVDDKRMEVDAGQAIEIGRITPETHKWLLENNHAERPE